MWRGGLGAAYLLEALAVVYRNDAIARGARDVARGAAAIPSAGEPAHDAATARLAEAATDFDERDINRNFDYDYDYEAYQEVKRNLDRLIGAGQLRTAMQLALELMKQGSYQVEMSDEGMMTAGIEDCLSVVLKAVEKCDLAAAEVIAWCSAMLATDRVGFIAQQPLQSLQKHFQAVAAR